MKQAVILAGGKGTRLKERLNGLPKPMIDICGLPLIERQILLLRKYKFINILILVNYESQKIKEFCNNNDNWGLNITCIEDGIPLGTAGATLNVYDLLMDEFLIVYGDTMLDVDLDKFHAFHKNYFNVAATLFLHPNDHPNDSDLVEINENNNIINFHPYPHNQDKYYPNLVNAALYWINKKSLITWKNKICYLDFGKDIFPEMLNLGYILRAYRSTEYIKDCGTPSRLDKVCSDFLNGKINRSKLTYKPKAVFLDRDGTINKEVGHLSNLDSFELIPNSANAIKNLNLSEYKICVITNQPVIARGDCSFNYLREIHNKLETLIGLERAYVDRIYFCPHHPDKGYKNEIKELKIDCDCRKPNTGMIKQAISDLNININESWLIGDTTTDILTAHNAGIKSILVETGYSGLDCKYYVIPDFICPDLFTASLFITSHYKIIFDFCNIFFKNITKGTIIKVGGLSRSGKSTFSGVLKYYLISREYKTHIISLDRWIKNKKDRSETVLGRYDVESIDLLLSKLADPNRKKINFELPFYNKKNNESIKNLDSIEILPDDIVIVEGTIVYEVSKNYNTVDCFVQIDENLRKERVIKEYLNRGISYKDSLDIYNSRLNDEVPFINRKTFMNANAIEINLENILKNNYNGN